VDHSFQLINANVGILNPDNCDVSSLVGEVQFNYTPPIHELTRVGFRDRTPFHVQVLCLALSNNDCEAVWTVPEGYTCESFANYASISSVTTLEANNPNIVQYCDSMTDIPAGLVRHRSHIQLSGPDSVSDFVQRELYHSVC